jgi:hypothetical protein
MQEITNIALYDINNNTLDSYCVMPVRIIVKLSENTALDLHHQQPSSREIEELSKIQRSLGIALEPLHPGIKDPSLTHYFTVEVPDEATSKLVIERLNLCKAVDAAYIKPSDELPGDG